MLVFLLRLPIVKNLLKIPEESSFKSAYNNQSVICSPLLKHAVNTPLTTLKCSLDELSEEIDSLQQVKLSQQAVDRLISIFNQLDDNPIPSNSTFHIKKAIVECATFFQIKYGDDFQSSFLISDDLVVKGQALLFQEALSCILKNAFESYLKTDDPYAHVFLFVGIENNRLRIDVVDFGVGMTDAARKLAQIKGISYKKSGQGLGLSFVRHVITSEMGGRMNISSQTGIGTRVSLRLPLIHQKNNQTRVES